MNQFKELAGTERLEALSDEARHGRPIDFSEALEVIAYQNSKPRKTSFLDKVKKLLKLNK